MDLKTLYEVMDSLETLSINNPEEDSYQKGKKIIQKAIDRLEEENGTDK